MALPLRLEPTETPNFVQLRLAGLTVFYSFNVPIAYLEGTTTVARNYEGKNPASRNHVNRVEPNSGARIEEKEFLVRLEVAITKACGEVK